MRFCVCEGLSMYDRINEKKKNKIKMEKTYSLYKKKKTIIYVASTEIQVYD